jgi:cytochrome c oxidase subunit IV
MSAHTAESAHKQTKIYKVVGAVLFAATVVIATFKGSLVAGYFMHLFSERKAIHWVLMLTAFFFVAMIALIMWTHQDQQGQPHGIFTTTTEAAPAHGE